MVALLKDGQQRGFSPGAFSPGAQEERCVLQFQQDECTIVGAAANGDLRAVRGFLRRDPQNLYKKSSGGPGPWLENLLEQSRPPRRVLRRPV